MSERKQAQLGLWGEAQVAAYLEQNGFQIVESRWRCRFGELDLVAADAFFLCFVEVKLRKDESFGPARVFVTPAKQKRLRLTAELYLIAHPTALQPRLDVAEIYAPKGTQTQNPKIVYLENAF